MAAMNDSQDNRLDGVLRGVLSRMNIVELVKQQTR